MLVDINLLPKKEQKSITVYLLIGLFLFAIIGGGVFFYWKGQGYDKKIASTERQIKVVQDLTAKEQQKQTAEESTNSVTELEKTVQWAKDYPLKTVPVLKHVTELLPHRGYMKQFTYTETGEIQLTVQFDTSDEAAYYLKSLTDSKWIAEASLLSLTTNEIDKDTKKDQKNNLLGNEKYIPRYLGEYTIKLNRDVVKKVEHQDEANEQGGNQ